jgi:hypothetical protein
MTQFMGFTTHLSEPIYQKIIQNRPNSLPHQRLPEDWSLQEQQEFAAQVYLTACQFNYELNCSHLMLQRSPVILQCQSEE